MGLKKNYKEIPKTLLDSGGKLITYMEMVNA